MTEHLTPDELDRLLTADEPDPRFPESVGRSPARLTDAARVAAALTLAADLGRAEDGAILPSADVIRRVVDRAAAGYDQWSAGAASRPAVTGVDGQGLEDDGTTARPSDDRRVGASAGADGHGRKIGFLRRPGARVMGLAASVVVLVAAGIAASSLWLWGARPTALTSADHAKTDERRLLEAMERERREAMLADQIMVAELRRAAKDASLTFRDAERRPIRQLRGFVERRGGVELVALAPDGRSVVTAGAAGTFELWDVSTGARVRTLPGRYAGRSRGRVATYSPDSRTVVTGGPDGLIRVWDAEDGREVRSLPAHEGGVTTVAFYPDGRALVSGGNDGTLKVWDAAFSQPPRTLTDPAGIVSAADVSPDGRAALTASADGAVRVWDLSSGRASRTFRFEPGVSVGFTPAGQPVVADSSGRTVAVLAADSDPTPPSRPISAPSSRPAGGPRSPGSGS